MPPIKFSQDELLSIIFAYDMLDSLSDIPFPVNPKRVKDKLVKYLPDVNKVQLNDLKQRLLFVSLDKRVFPNHLKTILSFVIQKVDIKIEYERIQKIDHFTVRPIGIYTYNNFWYVVGFVFKTNEYRIFRIDRVNNITPTHVKHSSPIMNLTEWINHNRSHAKKLSIKISVTKVGYNQLTNYWILSGDKQFINDHWEITFNCYRSHLQFIVRVLLSLGSEVVVLSPPSVIRSIQNEINKMGNIY
ncbi:helix-turn-helix transcriptional regulator [Nicoliella lavandulae]|uniref:WYL domain-containing protein n=1 Tax=Nicoliella lavandulae TaxID=3082954 RepID=A0ABU8SM08_9LACO